MDVHNGLILQIERTDMRLLLDLQVNDPAAEFPKR